MQHVGATSCNIVAYGRPPCCTMLCSFGQPCSTCCNMIQQCCMQHVASVRPGLKWVSVKHGYGLRIRTRITDYGYGLRIRITDYGIWNTEYGKRNTEYGFGIQNYGLWIWNYGNTDLFGFEPVTRVIPRGSHPSILGKCSSVNRGLVP